jgi:5-hydroxyisourate hydrolase-like protein (transthyretin family)
MSSFIFQRTEPAFAEVKMQNAAGRSHPDPVSTHILDTARGVPAADVAVVMFRMGGDLSWMKINSK